MLYLSKNDYDPKNPRCFLDGLLKLKEEDESSSAPYSLTDSDTRAIFIDIIISGSKPELHSKKLCSNIDCTFTKYRLTVKMFSMPLHGHYPGMLILVLVLVLKDSLRTFFKSLSWSLGVRSLSLSWSLGVRPLSLSWSLWSSPCPCLSPCKDLFQLFHYSDLLAYYCSVNAYS